MMSICFYFFKNIYISHSLLPLLPQMCKVSPERCVTSKTTLQGIISSFFIITILYCSLWVGCSSILCCQHYNCSVESNDSDPMLKNVLWKTCIGNNRKIVIWWLSDRVFAFWLRALLLQHVYMLLLVIVICNLSFLQNTCFSLSWGFNILIYLPKAYTPSMSIYLCMLSLSKNVSRYNMIAFLVSWY